LNQDGAMAKFREVRDEWMKDPLVRAGLGQLDIYNQVASLVRRIREKAGLTQTEVQEITGIGQAEISRIENSHQGRTPGIGTMAALGEAADMVLVVSYVSKDQVAEVLKKQKAGDALFQYSALLAK